MKVAVLLILTAAVLAADPADECSAKQHHGHLEAAKACYSKLAGSADPALRGEGFLGLHDYEQANEAFRDADKAHPDSAVIKTAWGRVYAEHAQPGDAAKLFQEAIESDKNYAPAYLELARVLAGGFDKNAIEMAQHALQLDPKLAAAHELLASMALEDGDPKLAADEAHRALAISQESLDGMAVLASIDWLDGKTQSEWMDRILAIDPVYGEAYATGAHFFVINRRYEEGVQFYRKALALNGELWDARSQLGINLMRIGREEEGRSELERCFNAHFRDAQTVNALRFLDTLPQYETFTSSDAKLVLNKKEASLLQPYIEPELQRAIATYERKYKMKLPDDVQLEVFPNHEDFIVRTLGLPGQGGLLGVTFGNVVAMDSPSARPPGEFNWASTMWHELSHVYVLSATHHLVPRWFTEGEAVHEEGVASPAWGNRLTPEIVVALQAKKLLPVLQLDRGFVRPEYETQVLVSYYQAGKILDFISEKWGDDAILGMIHSYAARKDTASAIEDNLHVKPEEFDRQFDAWLYGKTSDTVAHLDDFRVGLRKAQQDLSNGKRQDAIQEGRQALAHFPDYSGAGGTYQLLAKAYIEGGDKTNAARELEKYRDVGGTSVETLKELAGLEQDLKDAKGAERTLQELNYIYPEDPDVHRKLGGLLLASGSADAAVREYRAVLSLGPDDAAESHYNLARALSAANKTEQAKDEVLLTLEAAPNFKPAQKLLLELNCQTCPPQQPQRRQTRPN
jgi:tetratricopeptide (TPR) repeat protein